MSNSHETPLTADAWAREFLEMPNGRDESRSGQAVSSRDADTAALLQRIEQSDFVPWHQEIQAINLLAGRSSTAEAFREHDEAAARAALQAYQQEFFEFPPDHRQQRFEDLSRRLAEHPLLLQRLQSLSAGLDVDAASLEDERSPEVRELGELICKMFLAAPQERQRLQDDFETRFSRKQRRATAKGLYLDYPDIADLEAKYVDALRRTAMQRILESKPQPVAAGQTHTSAQQPPEKASTGGVILIAIVVLGLLRAVATRDSSSRSTYPPPQPNVPIPSYDPPEIPHFLREGEKPETLDIARLLYDSRRFRKAGIPMPLGPYKLWQAREGETSSGELIFCHPDGQETRVQVEGWSADNPEIPAGTEPIRMGPFLDDPGPPTRVFVEFKSGKIVEVPRPDASGTESQTPGERSDD